MPEEPKRLAPTVDTARALFLKSANLCAYPGCNELMMTANGDFVGQICHIEAALTEGERFNPNMNNEDRRNFSNLMLMCYRHHTETNDVSKFTVTVLQKMKADHEEAFTSVERAMIESFEDTTKLYPPQKAQTMNGYERFQGSKMTDEERASYLEEFNGVLERVTLAPLQARKFLSAVVRRFVETNSGASMLADDVCDAFNMEQRELQKRVAVLGEYRLAHFEEDDEGRWQMCVGPEALIWLGEFCVKAPLDLDSFLIKLRFDQLDTWGEARAA